MVKLAEGPRDSRKGNLDFSIQVEGDDEIADLARSFNSMVASLKRAEAENRELSRKMVHVAKMASMGKLAATVAHEINNPLGGILTYAKLISRKISAGPMTEEEEKKPWGTLKQPLARSSAVEISSKICSIFPAVPNLSWKRLTSTILLTRVLQ